MIRIAPDANLLVSGIPNPDGAPAAVVRLWRSRQIEFVVSEHVLGEVTAAWAKPYWVARFRPGQRKRAIRLLRKRSVIVDPGENIGRVASHWHDDVVIATTVQGRADYLLTGDKELRRVGEYQGVKIRTPQEFLEEFERAKPG